MNKPKKKIKPITKLISLYNPPADFYSVMNKLEPLFLVIYDQCEQGLSQGYKYLVFHNKGIYFYNERKDIEIDFRQGSINVPYCFDINDTIKYIKEWMQKKKD